MADRTTNISMPFILPSQAQKHVTHNEALLALDAIVHLAVEAELTAPPAAPAEGARFIVAADAGGDWAGYDGHIAARQDGAWSFFRPKQGWLAWFTPEQKLKIFDGSVWSTVDTGNATPDMLGINTSADSYNRLAVASEASLFTHVGHGHQAKINKSALTDTATLLFQSNWTGHAEIGLAGDNDFSIKVSNGADWHTALKIDQSGVINLPQRPAGRAYRNDGAVNQTDTIDSGFTGLDQVQGGVVLGSQIGSIGQALKVPAAGLYLISLLVTATSSSGHVTSLMINGSNLMFGLWAPAAAPLGLSHTQVAFLAAGDELSLRHTGTAQIYFAPTLTQLTVAML
ncbi:DUF2793 domain-containing protein [Neorhizobium sp. JUb45]|uniref:DUF2793 domain-containing protein n=1 Tax=unclassified Neorhizobium TaxID=2629175 RepID=UPI0010D9BF69|nr:DUF2793 domain-containing protein [Neorhizobium sp. JUb45]TCR06603.1 uncharacterized protein DUF2793 [Neorhizobium sp. JUb45]